jgi:hypothetical protein
VAKILPFTPKTANELTVVEINAACQLIVFKVRSPNAVPLLDQELPILDTTAPTAGAAIAFFESVLYLRDSVSVTLNRRNGGEVPLIKNLPLCLLGDISSYNEGANILGIGKDSQKGIIEIAVKISDDMLDLSSDSFLRITYRNPVALDLAISTIEVPDMLTSKAWVYDLFELPAGSKERAFDISAMNEIYVQTPDALDSSVLIDTMSIDRDSLVYLKSLENDMSFGRGYLDPLSKAQLSGGALWDTFHGSVYTTRFNVEDNTTLRMFSADSSPMLAIGIKKV